MKVRPGACAPGFVHGKKKGFAFRPFLRRKPAPQPGTLRWARFLPDEKSGKESPKAGPSPALWNPPRWYGAGPAFFSVRPWTRSCHIDGVPFYRLYLLLCWYNLLPPEPYPGMQLFPVAGGRAQKAPEHCRISCVVGCRGGACPSRIPQGNTREPTGRASHGPYRSATGWCSKTPGGGNAAVPGQARRWKAPSHRASYPRSPGVVAVTETTVRVTGRT